MLFLHEVHKVVGAKADEFEEAYRKGWMPMLAKGDDARLLWYTNHAMGSSVSYNVVTITAIKDGAAWERMALRFQKGDLRDWVNEVDQPALRRVGQNSTAGILVAHPGGGLQNGSHRRPRA